MSEPNKDKAMSLVGPINKAFSDLKASYRTSLTHALEFGRLLQIAHDAVGKKGWKAHLAANHPQISYRTATVYIQLAKHQEQFEDPTKVQHAALLGAADDLSIRDALNAVNKADGGPGKTRQPRQPRTGENVVDLATMLEDKAADEVVVAIKQKWDQDQQEQLLVQQLKSCAPSALSEILMKAYRPENIQALIETLKEKLREPQAPAASTPAVSSIRRPISAPAATTPTP
jgi:hypothetical protein